MNRIQKAFDEKKKVFIGFVTAGDPNLEVTKDLVMAIVKGGAGLVEFGIPFSDPVFQQHIICFASPYTLHFFIEMSQILRMDKAPPHPGKSIYIFPGQFKIIYCLGRPSDPSRYILHKIVVFPELAD